MALISEPEALSTLGSRLYDLRKIMVEAWSDYRAYEPAHRRLHSPTTRAGIVHDHIKIRARERFGANAVEVNKMLVVVIDQRLAVRFKRFHRDKRSRNIRTRQVEDYRMQRELPELRDQFDFVGELSHLEAGYILDQAEADIRETWLVCPSGLYANAWNYEIRDNEVRAVPPTHNVEPLFDNEGTIVRPKETTVVTIKRPDGAEEPS